MRMVAACLPLLPLPPFPPPAQKYYKNVVTFTAVVEGLGAFLVVQNHKFGAVILVGAEGTNWLQHYMHVIQQVLSAICIG